MTKVSHVEDVRGARASEWEQSFETLTALDATETLGAEDVEALGEAAWWTGRLPESIAARERAVASYVATGRPRAAALVALRLFYTFSVRGDIALATGWLRRATRLLEGEPEGIEHGQLWLAEARVARARGDAGAELGYARRAIALGQEFGDPDLVALGQYIEGRLLVRQGQVYDGMATLDEAMLAAAQGELGPMATGQVYCNVIAACHELGDLRRAGEWTEALSGWCANQPASVFPGLCRVHRAEVMRLRGAWSEAEHEARRASEDLLESMPAFASEAFYQLGEVRRRRGELDEAELEFRRASDLGREPQPGLALVRLAQGKTSAAAAAVRRALAQESDRLTRAKLLSAQVEIGVASGDVGSALAAAEELGGIAAAHGSTALQAAAAFARGRVELAVDQVPFALASLRRIRASRRDRRIGAHVRAHERPAASRRPNRAGSRGAEARRGRQEQPRDRGGAVSQREDDCAPPFQHLRQDRRLLAGGGDGVRLRAGADRRGVVGSHWVT